jgi:hypothetical protein
MAGCKSAAGLNVHLVNYNKLVDVHKHIDANKTPVAKVAAEPETVEVVEEAEVETTETQL